MNTHQAGSILKSIRGLESTALGVLGALLAATAALAWNLSPDWGSNPELSHGWFVPALFLLLLLESRRGTLRFSRPGPAFTFGLGFLLALMLLSLAVAGLYAATVDWSHAAVSVMLTLSYVLLVLAVGLIFARPEVGLVRLNWQLVVAAGIWLFAAPIPPGTYSRITLTLQLWVSEAVLNTLHLLGIAAVRRGNIIDLVNATVGIEEACSGIRSLISCIFAGLFFSATLVRRPWARALIIALAPPLALGMNFIRSLTLTLLAGNQVDIAGFWHDFTGFAVLGVTALILGALALVLEQEKDARKPVPPPATPQTSARLPLRAVSGAIGVGGVMLGFFLWNTRPLPPSNQPLPDLAALLPPAPAGWAARTPNLYSFSGTLQTNHLVQRDYLEPLPGGGSRELVIYAAYWRAGQAPVSLVASHTPDACWPGTGWETVSIPQTSTHLTIGGRNLPIAEQRVFRSSGKPFHVWFWHLHGRQPIIYRDPYSAVELLRYAWKYGFRRDRDQLFVRISANCPWAELADSPVLRDFFHRAAELGL
jgi:exosortase